MRHITQIEPQRVAMLMGLEAREKATVLLFREAGFFVKSEKAAM